MTQESDAGARGTSKPYLLRGIYQWALDNHCTPQILVNVDTPNVQVPLQYTKDGQIVLNLHPHSIRNLEMGNEYLMFSARFAGRSFEIIIPIESVMAVYAREDGHGIFFQADGSGVTPPPKSNDTTKASKPSSRKTTKKTKAASHLKLIK